MDPAVVGAADEEGAVLGEGGADLRVAVVVPLVLGPQVEPCSGTAAASAHAHLQKQCSVGGGGSDLHAADRLPTMPGHQAEACNLPLRLQTLRLSTVSHSLALLTVQHLPSSKHCDYTVRPVLWLCRPQANEPGMQEGKEWGTLAFI